jgi:plasmid stabilization system protein ParE
MPKSIFWSPLATSDFEKVLDHLNEDWNKKVVLEFINKIEGLLFTISKQPKQYPLVNKKIKVRRCVVTKHNTLFYRENKDRIELLRIFDTRQNPTNLKFF